MPEIEKTKESAAAVALLIDGENLTPDAAGWLINRASTMGPLRFRLVFGNAGRMPGWAEAPGFRLIHTGVGKNSADMALAIEAMALAYGHGIGRFAIATSDGDFSHLAHHLREKGHRVLGLGEAKAPPISARPAPSFRNILVPSHKSSPPRKRPPRVTRPCGAGLLPLCRMHLMN
ncbi:MAG: NYN domain-containing protein [Rhodobacteraceae bacterium]|nr:NYN domain-containing protein [Paracoccaceae bacterium]